MNRIKNVSGWLFFIVLFALGFSTFATAHEKEPPTKTCSHSLQPGKWALQFQIQNNFTLGSFQGSVFSLKRHFSSKTALRLGVSLDLQTGDENLERRILRADTLFFSVDSDMQQNARSVGVNIQFIHYPAPDKSIKPYWGGGPLLNYSWNKQENKESSLTIIQESTDEIKRWAIGAAMVLGAEWFASKNISFLAEYGISFLYFSGTFERHSLDKDKDSAETINRTTEKRSMNGYEIRKMSVKFGISVYW